MEKFSLKNYYLYVLTTAPTIDKQRQCHGAQNAAPHHQTSYPLKDGDRFVTVSAIEKQMSLSFFCNSKNVSKVVHAETRICVTK